MVDVTIWVLVPPVSGGLAFLTATMLRRDDIPETVGVPLLAALVGGIIANVRLGVIPADPGESQELIASLAARLVDTPGVAGVGPVAVIATVLVAAAGFAFIRRRTRESVDEGVRTFLLILGSVVAFSSVVSTVAARVRRVRASEASGSDTAAGEAVARRNASTAF